MSDDLRSLRQEVESWKEKSVSWEQEKKELIASAQEVLAQREKEMEQLREEQLRNCTQEHQKEVEVLKEQATAAEEHHKDIVSQWQSAADQVQVVMYITRHGPPDLPSSMPSQS